MPDFSRRSDSEIDIWIENHEKKGETDTELYRSLLEERARRQSRLLNIDKSLTHLIEIARARRFTTYGDLVKVNGIPWSQARHAMNGAHGHLDRLLEVCHARQLPLLTALCVNEGGRGTGDLSEEALEGFVKGAQRLGYQVVDGLRFLRECQESCFVWGRRA